MNDSFYAQFDSDAPERPKQREEGWQANRPDNAKPYVNNHPAHVKQAMTIEQKDNSYYEFDNLVFGRNPKDSFGQTVKEAYGEFKKDSDFRVEKQRYISLYREMMEQL